MEFNIEQEKLDIIKQYMVLNERYAGNENMQENFLQEIIKRGFIIFKNMDLNEESSKIYLNKIISSSIIYVLEHKDEYTINKEENKDSTKQISTDKSEKDLIKTAEQKVENKKQNKNKNYKEVKINFDFDYNPVIEGRTIKKSVLQKIYDTIVVCDSQSPEKDYLKIYNLRYLEKMSIENIAKKLNISENNVSKILFNLMEEVKKNID